MNLLAGGFSLIKPKLFSCLITILLLASIVGLSIPTASADITTGLSGYWPFNEGAGSTAYDFSGNGYTGTINNASWTTGKYGYGLNFTSYPTNTNVNTSSAIAPVSALTLSAWINPTMVNSWQQASVITKMSSLAPYLVWKMGLSDTGNIRFDVRANGNSNFVASSATVEAGTWYFIATTFDGRYLRIYINGVADGVADLGGYYVINDITQQVYVGLDIANSRFFNGTIDEARVYDRALSASDIEELYEWYNTPVATPTPDPSASPASGELPTTLNLSPFWQYLYAGNLLGWFQSIYLWSFLQQDILYGAICMIFLVPIYLKTKSLLLLCVLWILLGGFFIAAMPAVSGLAVIFLILGVGGVFYRLVRPN